MRKIQVIHSRSGEHRGTFYMNDLPRVDFEELIRRVGVKKIIVKWNDGVKVEYKAVYVD